MRKAIDDFLTYLEGDKAYSPRTVLTYRESLNAFEDFAKSKLESSIPAAIDPDVIRLWMAESMAAGKDARTVSKDMSALRSLFRYLLRTERVKKDPTRLVRNPKFMSKIPSFVKQSEMDRLLDEITFPESFQGERDRLILMTFYHTGLRVSELVGLNVEDLDLARGELKVTGKRNKQRIVPFGAELSEALRSYLENRRSEIPAEAEERPFSPLFINKKHKRITVSQVQAIVKFYLSTVTSQKKRSPHVLRHTFATVMLNNGAELEAIKDLLGHKSIATTEVYTHTSFAELKKVYKQAHPRS